MLFDYIDILCVNEIKHTNKTQIHMLDDKNIGIVNCYHPKPNATSKDKGWVTVGNVISEKELLEAIKALKQKVKLHNELTGNNYER